MTDKTLFPLPTPTLSDKQQIVYDLLLAYPAGLRSGELGQHLHQARDAPCSCSALVQCKWAMSDGERIGKQLRAIEPPLALKRKSGVWQLTRPPVTGHNPATAPIPF